MLIERMTLVALFVLGTTPSGAFGQVLPSATRVALAPGEIELTVASKGASINVADSAQMTFNIRCSGATLQEAKAKAKSTADNLVQKLMERGVPRESISVDEPAARLGFVGNEAAMMEGLPTEMQKVVAKQPRYATLSVQIIVTELALLPRVREMISQSDMVVLESPVYELKDDRAARRAAIADAVRRAQADAEAYASSLGLRVARMVRITDQAAQPSIMGNYAEMVERMVAGKDVASGKVATVVDVAADFVLVPR